MRRLVGPPGGRGHRRARRRLYRRALASQPNLNQAIQEYDRQIDQLAKGHPDFALFQSLPGAGKVLVPRLIAAFGTQRDRYQRAAEIQQYSGIAPVTEASGQQRWVHWRWGCPKFLRQTFHEWAAQSIAQCDWAAAYYRVQREDKNKSHHAAVRSLAYKWIRIAFRCWKDRCQHWRAILVAAGDQEGIGRCLDESRGAPERTKSTSSDAGAPTVGRGVPTISRERCKRARARIPFPPLLHRCSSGHVCLLGGFSGDGGSATAATLDSPVAVALDSTGNLYIADSGNSRVRRVSSFGAISTAAGNGAFGASGDGGPASNASFRKPVGIGRATRRHC